MIGLTLSEKTKIMNLINEIPKLKAKINELVKKVDALTPEPEDIKPLEETREEIPDAPDSVETKDNSDNEDN